MGEGGSVEQRKRRRRPVYFADHFLKETYTSVISATIWLKSIRNGERSSGIYMNMALRYSFLSQVCAGIRGGGATRGFQQPGPQRYSGREPGAELAPAPSALRVLVRGELTSAAASSAACAIEAAVPGRPFGVDRNCRNSRKIANL